MRTIDADALMPLFMEKANTMKDRHGVKLGEEWLLNYNDIKDVIDNAPTIDTDMSEYSDKLWKAAYERGKAKGRKTGHWINRCRGSSFCSVCGGEEPTEDIEFMNYCPNCGAKMTKEGENECKNNT